MKIKRPVVSPVILEGTLRYIVKNLFLQLHLLLTQLNNPKLAIKYEDSVLDLQAIVNQAINYSSLTNQSSRDRKWRP